MNRENFSSSVTHTPASVSEVLTKRNPGAGGTGAAGRAATVAVKRR
jgi:hypothetical protein